MTTLTVGSGQQFRTIAAAVAASASGDTINVDAGTYTNDFLNISHDLTVQGVGGAVNLVATVQPPNGKAIIDEGGSGVTVTLAGLTLSGATVGDGNGAGVRYEGGTLVMNNMTVRGNQDGLLGNVDSAGSITIDNSTFTNNGSGDGRTHNIYVGAINSLTVTNSTITDAVVGHGIKSRAANNLITGNTITDTSGTGSYEIDLPNGGNAVISNNTIEKGANAQNPVAIAYGEEGSLYANGSLTVTNNLIVSDYKSHITYAVWNSTSFAATVTGNTFYGWNNLSLGTATLSGNTIATTEPALTAPGTGPTPTPAPPPTPTPTPITLGNGPDSIVLNVSEDAWQGDAQFTVSVDGRQLGGTQTAAASHGAGQTQAVTLLGSFGAGQHTVGVNFLNDAWGGTAATDRNLYVDSIVDGATITRGAALMSSGTQDFIVGTPTPVDNGRLVLQMSEDAWKGDAQFTVAVDGHQVGGTMTTTALHNLGQTQAFDIGSSFVVGSSHQVAISFLNDAWGGTADTDRNLHVDKIGATPVNATLYSAGTQTFTAVIPAG